jgi:hypothetical protein
VRPIEEQRLALECLRLADGNIDAAEAMLAFVTGSVSGNARQASAELSLEERPQR